MMYTNHRNTALAVGLATISVVPVSVITTHMEEFNQSIIYLVYLLFLGGVFIGNKYGPDLDHPNSVARKDGALEFLIGLFLAISAFLMNDIPAVGVILILFLTLGVLVQAKILKGDFRKIVTVFSGSIAIFYLFFTNLTINENYIYFLTFLPSLIFMYIALSSAHRKFIHSLPFCILLVGSLLITSKVITNNELVTLTFVLNVLIIGYAVGFVTHLVMDSFSISGVPFLYPFTKKNYGIKMYKTQSKKKKALNVATKSSDEVMTESGFAMLVIILMGIVCFFGLLI